MKNLIIYASKYGTTEKCVGLLKPKLRGDVQVVNVKDKNAVAKLDLTAFDKIMIGGSIHAGKVQSQITRFCTDNFDQLQQKKVGFFLCTLEPPAKAEHYHHENFPIELVGQAQALGCFGGELIFEKMNFLEKFILQKIAKTKQNISQIDTSRISQFAEKMNA